MTVMDGRGNLHLKVDSVINRGDGGILHLYIPPAPHYCASLANVS